MKRKNKVCIPSDFFSISRPKISMKKVLKDVRPINWINKKHDKN